MFSTSPTFLTPCPETYGVAENRKELTHFKTGFLKIPVWYKYPCCISKVQLIGNFHINGTNNLKLLYYNSRLTWISTLITSYIWDNEREGRFLMFSILSWELTLEEENQFSTWTAAVERYWIEKRLGERVWNTQWGHLFCHLLFIT